MPPKVIERSRISEQHETLEQKVWAIADRQVDRNLGAARSALEEELGSEQVEPFLVAALAHAYQTEFLAQADVESMNTSDLTGHRIALATLEVPAAIEFQRELDQSQVNGKERSSALQTVVQFNHDLAEAVACMPSRMLGEFPVAFFERARKTFEPLGLPVHDEAEGRRVMKGIQLEVALLRAVQTDLSQEWQARAATVDEDKRGIDVLCTNESGQQIGIDTKSPGAYRDRLQKKFNKGLISEEEQDEANQKGFIQTQAEPFPVYMVASYALGTVREFEFTD